MHSTTIITFYVTASMSLPRPSRPAIFSWAWEWACATEMCLTPAHHHRLTGRSENLSLLTHSFDCAAERGFTSRVASERSRPNQWCQHTALSTQLMTHVSVYRRLQDVVSDTSMTPLAIPRWRLPSTMTTSSHINLTLVYSNT